MPEYYGGSGGSGGGMMTGNGHFTVANTQRQEIVNQNQQPPSTDVNGLPQQSSVIPVDNAQQQQQATGFFGSAYNTVGRGVAATANFARPFVNHVGPQVVKAVVPGFGTAIASSLGPFGSVAGGIIGLSSFRTLHFYLCICSNAAADHVNNYLFSQPAQRQNQQNLGTTIT